MAERFQAYEVAMEMATGLRPLLERITRRDRDLENQLRRSGASVVLNIAEGARRAGRDRQQFYRIAAGSAAETQSGLQLAVAWGYVGPDESKAALHLVDRVLAMLWRLTHARR